MTLKYIEAAKLLLLMATVLTLPLSAQNAESETQEYFKHQNYGSALPLIVKQLEKSPDHALLNYQAGVCYLHSRSLKANAAEYLEKAIEYSPSLRTKAMPGPHEAPADAHKLLGDAYYYAYKFEHAVKAYEKYKELNAEKAENGTLLAEVSIKADMCRHLKNYRPTQALPLSAKTGSPCGELVQGTVTGNLSPDKSTMIYTIKVPVDKLQKQDESSRYYEDTNFPPEPDSAVRSETAKSALKKHVELDTVVYATTVGTSFDGQVTLTYRNDDGDGNIYIARLRDNKWSAPSKMKKCANKAGWEPYESLSADGNFLYFASERPGGLGGMDIYRCRKQPDGSWSKAVNLGPSINTAADEVAPFIYSDDVTLFFSSNRIRPGSYDIFSATAATATNWSTPVNVGFPVNRHPNDIFQVTADNRKLYASTPSGVPEFQKIDSVGSSGTKPAKTFSPDRDNYLITFTGQQKVPLNLRRGTVTDESGEAPATANISVIDNASSEVYGHYHTTDLTGAFAFILPAGKNLQILYEAEGHLPQSENVNLSGDARYFEEYKAVKLPPLAVGSHCTLSNVFFDADKTVFDVQSKTELDRIVALLRANPGMEIELENIIFTRHDGKFYKHLSKARAKELAAYFVKQGISSKRISASGTQKKPVTEKTPKPAKGKPKSRKPIEDKVIKPVQVLTLKISKIKNDS